MPMETQEPEKQPKLTKNFDVADDDFLLHDYVLLIDLS
jgi:hypothetical protein